MNGPSNWLRVELSVARRVGGFAAALALLFAATALPIAIYVFAGGHIHLPILLVLAAFGFAVASIKVIGRPKRKSSLIVQVSVAMVLGYVLVFGVFLGVVLLNVVLVVGMFLVGGAVGLLTDTLEEMHQTGDYTLAIFALAIFALVVFALGLVLLVLIGVGALGRAIKRRIVGRIAAIRESRQ